MEEWEEKPTTRIRELVELAIGSLALAFAFSYPDLADLPLVLLLVSPAFVLHELAHKAAAKAYGIASRFRLWFPGLIITALSALTSFGIYAVGAVYLLDAPRSKGESGVISLAGPLSNVAIALISMWVNHPIAYMAAAFNLRLALFNLLPIAPLDGREILSWGVSKFVAAFWALIMACLLMEWLWGVPWLQILF